MNTRMLGKNLIVSSVSLGCMGMTHASGSPADPKEMTKLLHEAADILLTVQEVNTIDKRLNQMAMSQVFGDSPAVK